VGPGTGGSDRSFSVLSTPQISYPVRPRYTIKRNGNPLARIGGEERADHDQIPITIVSLMANMTNMSQFQTGQRVSAELSGNSNPPCMASRADMPRHGQTWHKWRGA